MSDIDESLKAQRMASMATDKKVEALQLQLSGAAKRNNELKNKIEELEKIRTDTESQIQMLNSEISKYKSALDRMSTELKESRSSTSQKTTDNSIKENVYNVDRMDRQLKNLETNLENISKSITEIINGELDTDSIRNVVISYGDLYHRVLNLVISKRSLKISDIPAMLNVSDIDITPILDKLSASGDIEIRSGLTVLSDKYDTSLIDINDWNNMELRDIFTSMNELLSSTQSYKDIAAAIEKLADIIEQSVPGAGVLMFEMRKTSRSWNEKFGDIEELKHSVREWQMRTS